jgi:CheY-like chemotaxis protein
MHVERSKERLWSRLIRPLLWPVLLVQLALVMLCALLGLILWSTPSQASWSITFWLMLALLVGSSLNVVVFLTLLRQRLASQESGLVQLLSEHEQWLREASQELPSTVIDPAIPEDPRDRIRRLLDGMQALSERRGPIRLPDLDDQDHSQLLEALESHERRLDQLRAGHQRAQEESRLKSDYLIHLRRELKPLMGSLSRVMDADIGALRRNDPSHLSLMELRERLADISVLLGSLTGDISAPGQSISRLGVARILIVDDGPVNLTLARQVLEGQGASVETATTGNQALECLAGGPFDLVLMDIFMPDLDGMETSRRWREREISLGHGRRSVLIALTANASEADQRRFLEAGMDDYLAKPYRPQALVDRVIRWLPEPTGQAQAVHTLSPKDSR